MKIFVIANQKGGVGKSTLSCHLSWYLGETQRVLHLDLDPQKNSSKTLRSHACAVPASAFFGASAPRIPAPEAPGIVAVPADDALLEVERQPNQVIAHFRRGVLAQAGSFDSVVIDTAPTAGVKQSAALIAATDVVAPVELEQYSIDGMAALLQTILGIKQKFNPGLNFLGLLPNRFNAVNPGQRAALEQLLARYPQYMVPAKVPTRSAISDAIAAAVPVWELQKTSAREAGKELRAVLGLLVSRSEA